MNSSTNLAYVELLNKCLFAHHSTSPRSMPTLELINNTTIVDMKHPFITLRPRSLNYRFMLAEAYWIITGDQRVETIIPYCGNIYKFSDDHLMFSGAYGPRFLSQVRYVVDVLTNDVASRQAVITIWERNPRQSFDIPCTVSLQFLIRTGMIHTIVNMRSSDAWLGWPYDIFNFTMMTLFIKTQLHYKLDLGLLHINAGSQHLYERNMAKARELVNQQDEIQDIIDIDFNTISSPQHLWNQLCNAKDNLLNGDIDPLWKLQQLAYR